MVLLNIPLGFCLIKITDYWNDTNLHMHVFMNKISLQQQHTENPKTLAPLMFVIIQTPLLMNNLAISRNEPRLTD